MMYVFDRLLPKSYWQELSKTSLKYSVAKKAGKDSNADKAPDDRHPQYQGKGKQRPWDPKWVSPNGLLLFHESMLLMVLNRRGDAQQHFPLDSMLRSVVAEQYTRDSWSQTFRFFCPYDVDEYERQKAGTSEYNPYLKFDLIQTTLFDGIHSIMVPPKVGSYDEGGKPWQGKGGTHRKNDKLPELTWPARYERGETRWATAKHSGIPFLYLEYGDNKVVRLLSTKHGSPHDNSGRTQERWDSDTRTYQDIFLPQLKLDYDAGMMWVDFADFF
ncbi:hypothetical protein CYMTET_42035 [Cymbomonas tetramitiformis]|uniref:Uncharacterized protein n=1 Tax=Cymbomonas tetramitiformis TaxID=36881 RepID=A0AAE0C713_9CHLO|nr:hypothetical protein CYMTET_42035 [Cymbomonas tetramitiformis]